MTVQHRFELTELPPIMNHCRIPSKVGKHARLIDSPEYRAWKTWAHLELSKTRLRLPDHTYWRASLLIPGKSKADIDAYTKQTVDALVAAECVPDDRYLCDYRVRWHDGETLIVHVRTEPVYPWADIRRAGKTILKRLQTKLI
jgi:Holliday junction resolvase RusA-like endonuclease